MPSYDFRLIDDAIVPKVTNFIQKSAKNEDPFFIYYGMRSGKFDIIIKIKKFRKLRSFFTCI